MIFIIIYLDRIAEERKLNTTPAIVCASVSHNGNQTVLTVETASQILCYISLGLIFESANKTFFHKSDNFHFQNFKKYSKVALTWHDSASSGPQLLFIYVYCLCLVHACHYFCCSNSAFGNCSYLPLAHIHVSVGLFHFLIYFEASFPFDSVLISLPVCPPLIFWLFWTPHDISCQGAALLPIKMCEHLTLVD